MADKHRPLSDARAVVVGGATGIGAGICRALGRHGASLDILDRDMGNARALAAELAGEGSDVAVWEADVTSPDTLVAAEAEIRRLRGGVDLLFANAGAIVLKPFLETTPDDWRWLFETNVLGTVNVLQAFLPNLLAQDHPSRLVVTSSVSALRAADTPGLSIYVASKSAQLGLCSALRQEIEGSGVGLSVVLPGPVKGSLGAHSEEMRPGAIRLQIRPTASASMISGDEAGRRIVLGTERGQPYISCHPEERAAVAARAAEILTAFA